MPLNGYGNLVMQAYLDTRERDHTSRGVIEHVDVASNMRPAIIALGLFLACSGERKASVASVVHGRQI